jgi:hypothetical protein
VLGGGRVVGRVDPCDLVLRDGRRCVGVLVEQPVARRVVEPGQRV